LRTASSFDKAARALVALPPSMGMREARWRETMAFKGAASLSFRFDSDTANIVVSRIDELESLPLGKNYALR